MLSLLLLTIAADPAEADAAERLMAAELPRWSLRAGNTALPAPKESALRWTNPAAGRVYGNTYVWTQNGRPAAVSCLFRNVEPWNTLNAEWSALTVNDLVATRNGNEMWRPDGEWKWTPVPGAPAPAVTPGQRLVQMKAIAGEFTVEVLDTRNEPRGENQTPRLLAKPLFRYDPAQKFDGGLYAFVLGTDPELMVLLECDTAAAPPAWRFGVARMNRDTVRLKHKGVTVWEAASTRTHRLTDRYYFFGLPLAEGKR